MAKVYGEFGIEIVDDSIKNICIETMRKIGSISIKETRRKTTIIDYSTPTEEVFNLEELSDLLCNIIEPHQNELKNLLQRYADRIYSDICFVKVSDEKDVSVKINKRLIQLVYELKSEINFDGF